MTSNLKYCTKCGNEMLNNDVFCTKCGARNKTETINISKEYKKTVKVKKSVNTDEYLKKGKSKIKTLIEKVKEQCILHKKKLLPIGLLTITLVILSSVLTKVETDSELVEKLQNAIIDKNVTKLEKIIKSSDKRLEVDEKAVNILLSYYDENPSKLNSDMDYLLWDNSESTPFKFERKKFLFKEKTIITLQPRYIVVEGNADNIEIEIMHNNEVIKTADKYGEIGPLVPGSYKVSATFKNDFVERNESQEVDIFSSTYDGQNILKLFDDINNIEIETNKPEAILYVDGKSTKKKIKDINNIVGLDENTKIYAILQEGENTLKSNVEEIYGSGTYNLQFEEITEENIEEFIYTFIEDYENGYQSAVNEGNFDLVAEYLYEGTEVYDEYNSNIKLFYENKISRYIYEWYIQDITKLGNDSYKVVVQERVGIDRNGNEETKNIESTCTVEVINGSLYITKLTEK